MNTKDQSNRGALAIDLGRLAVALAVTGVPVANCCAEGDAPTRPLLLDLVQSLATMGKVQQSDSTTALQSQAEAFAELIDKLAHAPRCAQHGRVFLRGDVPGAFGQLVSSITLHVEGNLGSVAFSFISGTTLEDISNGIGSYGMQTGVWPQMASTNSLRLELAGGSGSHGFVSVTQEGGETPMLVDVPNGGTPKFAATDFGADQIPGDVDCDWSVGPADLNLILQTWGPCAVPIDYCLTDIDYSGAIDMDDLLVVIRNWGMTG